MTATVICLYKANSPLPCEKYKLIPLLTVMSNIIEPQKLVYVRSQEYLCN